MPTVNFNSTLIFGGSISATDIRCSTTLTDPLWVSGRQSFVLTNTKTGIDQAYPSAVNLLVAGTKIVDCAAGSPFGDPFEDGVYRSFWTIANVGSNDYTSTAYLLQTATIDAWWDGFLSLEDPTITNWQYYYNLYAPKFASIQTLSADLATNYAAINVLIAELQIAAATRFQFTFDSTLALTNPSTMTAQTQLLLTGVTANSAYEDITNTRTSENDGFDFSPFSAFNVAGTKTNTFNSRLIFGYPNFSDAVYSGFWFVRDSPTLNTYTSNTTYLLVTTAIDTLIASYDPSDAFRKLHRLRILSMRQSVDTFFAAGDYVNCNLYIGYIEDALAAVAPTPMDTFNSTLQLTNRNTLLVNVPSGQAFNTPLLQSLLQNNLTWNSLEAESRTGKIIASTFAQSGSGSASFDSVSVYNLSYYEDGVQWFYVYFWTPTHFYGSNALTVITTTIDEQWITFQANYDPTDDSQLVKYNLIKADFADIADKRSSVASQFTAINNKIIEIQGLLALFVVPNIRVTLPSKDNILVEITTNIPNVTYDSQKLVLSNCGDPTQEYTLEYSFPLNYVDVNKTLNSNEINFGSQYADGVYQAYVSWNTANSMNFGGSGYVLVTTQIDCGIAKIIAQHPTCKALNNRLNEIMTYRRIITESFNNEDYNSTFFYINLCLNLLTKSGCNCGC